MGTAIIGISILGLGIAGMAIKSLFGKGQLEKSCASASRLFNEEGDGTCQFCGASSEEACKNED